MNKVLMVEDDLEITALLGQYLPKYNIQLNAVSRPSVALEKLKIEKYDLVLLDLSLPEIDGIELCELIKKEHPKLPIIISTARADVSDKVIGLGVGADDYMPKPYDPRELVARIQSVLRRYNDKEMEAINQHLFEVDKNKMQIFKSGEPIELTLAEYEIFSLLLSKRLMVVSREYIANSVNSINWDSTDRSIDVIIGRIRQKIGDNPKKPIYIKSVRGVGYKYIGA